MIAHFQIWICNAVTGWQFQMFYRYNRRWESFFDISKDIYILRKQKYVVYRAFFYQALPSGSPPLLPSEQAVGDCCCCCGCGCCCCCCPDVVEDEEEFSMATAAAAAALSTCGEPILLTQSCVIDADLGVTDASHFSGVSIEFSLFCCCLLSTGGPGMYSKASLKKKRS